MRGSRTDVVSIPETIRRQLFIYGKDPGFKLLGILLFLCSILGPYILSLNYWNKLEELIPDKFWFLVITSTSLGIFLHLATLLAYMMIYKLKHPFFEQYKDNDKSWPWEYDPEFSKKLIKAIKLVAFNNLVCSPLFALINCSTGLLDGRTKMEEIPSFWVYLCQIIFMAFSEDLMFYHCHRLLHHPKLYPYIHKVHHEFYDTICISSEYAHPIEYILGNLIPSGIGYMLFCGRAHHLSFLVFLSLRLIETVESHGGYDFPWAVTRIVPYNVSSKYHNYHHLKNIGNYGSFFILWDSIYGTNSHYYEELVQTDKNFEGYKNEVENGNERKVK